MILQIRKVAAGGNRVLQNLPKSFFDGLNGLHLPSKQTDQTDNKNCQGAYHGGHERGGLAFILDRLVKT